MWIRKQPPPISLRSSKDRYSTYVSLITIGNVSRTETVALRAWSSYLHFVLALVQVRKVADVVFRLSDEGRNVFYRER